MKKMSMKQEFFITLPSNVKSKDEEDFNTVTNYKTHLKQRIIFPIQENWFVGLSEVTYPKTWYNVREKIESIDYFTNKGNSLYFFKEEHNLSERYDMIIKRDEFFIDHTMDIQPGYYSSIDDLITKLNKKMNFYDSKDFIIMPQLFFDKNRQRIYLTAGYQYIYQTSSEFEASRIANRDFTIKNNLKVHQDLRRHAAIHQSTQIVDFLGNDCHDCKNDPNREFLKKSDNDDKNEDFLKQSDKKLKFIEYKFFPSFGKEVESILGLTNYDNISLSEKLSNQLNYPEITDAFNKGYYFGPRSVDIKAGFSSIYIYSDIVQHSFVGDAYAQLLRTIPVSEKTKWGDSVQVVFNEPHLIPIQNRNFDIIEIDVRDDTGQNIPFNSGKFLVKLIFRKYG